MNKQTRVSRQTLGFEHTDVESFDSLAELALDIAQTPARQIVYIENTPLFVTIAEGLGIQSVLHADCKSTCVKLASFGLQVGEGVFHETS